MTYDAAVCDQICERLAEGRSLKSICGDADMPAQSTVFRWLARYPEFVRQYAAARDSQAHALFDELVGIADEAPETPAGVSRAKLKIDTRKWWLARIAPKRYGDRLDLEPPSAAEMMTREERRARIKVLLAKAADGFCDDQ